MRDLSSELGKQIELEMQGSDTELDRQVLDMIKDPLTHMVRNSADHGIETTSERRAAGKRSERATIRLAARHEGGHIIVEVSMTAAGSIRPRSAAKALASGLVAESDLDKMSDTQIQRFSLQPACRRLMRSPQFFAVAASAWMWCSETSIRSAARSTRNRCRGRVSALHDQDSAHSDNRVWC